MNELSAREIEVLQVLKNNYQIEPDGKKTVENPMTVLTTNIDTTRQYITELLRKLERKRVILIHKSGVVGIGGGLITKVQLLKNNYFAI